MLQIVIIHGERKTYISEIKDLDSLISLSQFDKEKCKIDLEPLVNHVGERVLVTHFIKKDECTRLDYEHEKTITKVDKDEHNVWYVEYT